MTSRKYQSAMAIVVSALLMTTSCDESSNLPTPSKSTTTVQAKSNPGARIANYTFDGTEGDPITLDVAIRWIGNYTSQNLGKLTAHFIGKKALEKMLAKNGSVGVRFYYSLDDSANPVLFATAADGTGQDFSSDYRANGRNSSLQLDAKLSTYTFTDEDGDSTGIVTAKHWIDNYNLSNPSSIQAHFFGFEIIEQILAENECIGIRCYYALNDSGIPQLLLVGVTSSGQNILPLSSTGGRTMDGGGTVADASAPCPSYCN